MTQYYKQCTLRKGDTEQTAWVPEHFAHLGFFIKLKDKGVVTDGWLVILVGEHRMSEEDLRDKYSQDYKHQRKQSDI